MKLSAGATGDLRSLLRAEVLAAERAVTSAVTVTVHYATSWRRRPPMADVQSLIDHTIDALEGGFVDHPADKGGPTKYGITQRVYAEHLGRPVTVDEVRRMPRAHAVAIHRDRYWERPKLHLLPDALHPVAFDMAVNHGARAACG